MKQKLKLVFFTAIILHLAIMIGFYVLGVMTRPPELSINEAIKRISDGIFVPMTFTIYSPALVILSIIGVYMYKVIRGKYQPSSTTTKDDKTTSIEDGK